MLFSKGVVEFVEAARRLRGRGVNARFLLVGEPDPDNPGSVPNEMLQQFASDGSIEYAGRSENMPAVFAQIDVFCLPTYYGEGIPKVLVEAAASGLPSVTTDWPGCRDVVKDEETGLLVPPRNVERLTDALERLIRDRELRIRMGARARERAAQFSLPIVLDKTLAVYRELLE
jgi:glycosyltransferase involved in cell wall biosynthesis